LDVTKKDARVKDKYFRSLSLYECRRCHMPIEVESEQFYWFGGPDDPNFWCPNCQDLPQADIIGAPAEQLPAELHLPKGFTIMIVPPAEPADVKTWNAKFKPYSKRSFLRQYLDWVKLSGLGAPCSLNSCLTAFAPFDVVTQQYDNAVIYQVADLCDGRPCQFLRNETMKPTDVNCDTIWLLCDVRGTYGLCETGDEAMFLQQYLLLSGDEHFPMLIPQPSILKGARRPDFVAFVPVTKFQYHKVAILVDRPGKDANQMRSEENDYEQDGYVVRRVLIDGQGSYYKKARELILWMERM
jgi:hypothetical protein